LRRGGAFRADGDDEIFRARALRVGSQQIALLQDLLVCLSAHDDARIEYCRQSQQRFLQLHQDD